MDASLAPAVADVAAPLDPVGKTASQSASPVANWDIVALPTAHFELEMEAVDSALNADSAPIAIGNEKTDPISESIIDVTLAIANNEVESAAPSPAGNIIAAPNLQPSVSALASRPQPDGSIFDSLITARGESSGSGDVESILSSLRRKETNTALSNRSSPLSTLPNLPNEDIDIPNSPPPNSSRFYNTRTQPVAESSAQALKRATRLSVSTTTQPTAPTPKVTRSASEAIAAANAPAPRRSSKRNRDERETGENGRVGMVEKAPRAKKRKATPKDEVIEEVGEALKTIDEAVTDEKPYTRGKRKVAPKPIRARAKPVKKVRQLTDAQLRESMKGKTREVQPGTCIRPRYAKWGKCTQCTSKSGKDSCRFREFRLFPVDPKTGEICGPGFFESTDLVDQTATLPTEFTVPLAEEHLRSIEESAAPILLPLITRELRHVSKTNAIQRAVDSANDRSYCDFCSSTIFAGYFFCKACGKDYCLSCERYFSDNAETMDKSPWHLVTAARTRLLKCVPPPDAKGPSGRKEQPPTWHFRSQLQPVSALSDEELKKHWLALAEFVVKGTEKKSDWSTLLGYSKEDSAKLADEIESFRTQHKATVPPDDRAAPTPVAFAALYTKYTRDSVRLPIDPAGLREKSHPFMRITSPDNIDNSAFDQIWSQGEPIVVDGVGDHFNLDWTPNQMISQFGKERCEVSDCERDVIKGSSIKDFFESFKEHSRRSKEVLKLQDWPASEGFQKKHPGLYKDFCGALPVSDYTQQNGAMNLYSHFPVGPTRPDIGPKMYSAFAGKETKGGHGSTRLHVDVADAINIMLYASPCTAPMDDTAIAGPSTSTAVQPAVAVDEQETVLAESGPSGSLRTKSRSLSTRSGNRPAAQPTRADAQQEQQQQQPGCAVWDVFRAEDADQLRAFLGKKFAKSKVDFMDPIHSQMFYLDSALRQELHKTMGVVSFRIYQYPGQAVFIPAGCAHQVCNLSDCIKIAMDFVSPHNVSRCQQLTQDFRKENFVKAWKDDVLQLYNILWFAWLSSRDTRELLRKEKEAAEIERLNSVATLAELDMVPSSIGRGLVSSVRDDPASSLRLDSLPLPPTVSATAGDSTAPAVPMKEVSADPIKALLAKLFEAALSAPDCEPPEDARPPLSASAAGWGRAAKNAHASGSGSGGQGTGLQRKRTRASILANGDREGTPLMTVASVRALGASGKRINKASDAFRSGDLPMAYAVDIVAAEMGQGGDVVLEGD